MRLLFNLYLNFKITGCNWIFRAHYCLCLLKEVGMFFPLKSDMSITQQNFSSCSSVPKSTISRLFGSLLALTHWNPTLNKPSIFILWSLLLFYQVDHAVKKRNLNNTNWTSKSQACIWCVFLNSTLQLALKSESFQVQYFWISLSTQTFKKCWFMTDPSVTHTTWVLKGLYKKSIRLNFISFSPKFMLLLFYSCLECVSHIKPKNANKCTLMGFSSCSEVSFPDFITSKRYTLKHHDIEWMVCPILVKKRWFTLSKWAPGILWLEECQVL